MQLSMNQGEDDLLIPNVVGALHICKTAPDKGQRRISPEHALIPGAKLCHSVLTVVHTSFAGTFHLRNQI